MMIIIIIISFAEDCIHRSRQVLRPILGVSPPLIVDDLVMKKIFRK